jgi:hypothetical protein
MTPVRNRQIAARAARFGPRRGAVTPAAIVPFDFVATFDLNGRPGDVHEDVINIMPDGAFVAVAVSYGLDEDRSRPMSPERFDGARDTETGVVMGDVRLGELSENALLDGVRINPVFEPSVRQGNGSSFSQEVVARDRLFQLVGGVRQPPRGAAVLEELVQPSDISFYFSIVDTATGRELQERPIHNLASLGRSDGDRPFRPLARPLSFQPRSTLRVQVVEDSVGVRGRLFVVLSGFALLGISACPEPMARALLQSALRPVRGAARLTAPPGSHVVPFDHVAVLELTGRSREIAETEIHVSLDGQFVATAMGYGLAVPPPNVTVQDEDALSGAVISNGFDLAEVPLRAFSPQAFLGGIRIRPEFRRIVFTGGGGLTSVRREVIDRMFEPLNRSRDVSFLYSFFDTGVGRELQNQPIHNIAGLGIADGSRPFRQLARPMPFRPRSTIRVRVEERFGRGQLYIALHGFKVLGSARAGV